MKPSQEFGDDEPTREYPRELRNPTTISDAPELEDGAPPDDDALATIAGVPFPSLTAREREIALLLVIGKKNREIADELNISIKTVDTHRSHVLQKCEKRNNVELALHAVREGWIVP